MSEVFISRSWEDNAISRQLVEYLNHNSAEIWIDYARIRGDESLPDKMNESLEWCDTLVLIWTAAPIASSVVACIVFFNSGSCYPDKLCCSYMRAGRSKISLHEMIKNGNLPER